MPFEVDQQNITIPAKSDHFPLSATLLKPLLTPATVSAEHLNENYTRQCANILMQQQSSMNEQDGTTNDAKSQTPPPPKIVCVIAPATGVKRSFYDSFAKYLCSQYGMVVVYADYRGIGDSKLSESLVGMEADIVDWCRKDVAGVLEWVFEHFPQKQKNDSSSDDQDDGKGDDRDDDRDDAGYYRTVYVGHSVGAHALALMYPEINARIERVLTVSANLAYLGYFRWNSTYVMTLLAFYLMRPLVNMYYGYFPSNTLFGLMEDLPAGLANQWAWFMRHREYFVSYADASKPLFPEGFQSLRAPVLSLSFDNDHIAPEKQFDEFHKRFTHSRSVVRMHYRKYKCGHMFFFRIPPSSEQLWHSAAQYLVNGTLPPLDGNGAETTTHKLLTSKL